MNRFRITCHDAHADDLVPIGTLAPAGEIKINPIAAKADIRIGIGSILPHPMNGFGGGAKILLPGVANVESIQAHHNALMIARGASFGRKSENPFRDEICKAARMARLDAIINAPMDFNCALNLTLLYLSRVKIILVCQDADKEQAARMGFGYADSLSEAFSKVAKKVPGATVNILPSGGLIVPLKKEPLSWTE